MVNYIWTKISLATSMCFILLCSFILLCKRRKPFMRLVWLGAKILHTYPLIWKTKLNVLLSLFFSTVSSEWEKEKYNADEKGRTPSLLRAVIRAFGKGYIALGFLAIITVSSVCNVCSTLFQPSWNNEEIFFSSECLNCKPLLIWLFYCHSHHMVFLIL